MTAASRCSFLVRVKELLEDPTPPAAGRRPDGPQRAARKPATSGLPVAAFERSQPGARARPVALLVMKANADPLAEFPTDPTGTEAACPRRRSFWPALGLAALVGRAHAPGGPTVPKPLPARAGPAPRRRAKSRVHRCAARTRPP
ncbi:MAG: hypothetical protein WKG07_18455 [Hymenobacter sp.]